MSQEVANCVLATAAQGQPPDACLVDILLAKLNKKKEDYFVYESITSSSGGGGAAVESLTVDACEVFTGPAAALPANNTFRDCVVNDLQTQCNIPSFVWSGRSTGRTPVGNFHSWTDAAVYGGAASAAAAAAMAQRVVRAQAEFQGISLEMVLLIKAVNDSFASDNIAGELFSAEGDALHQLMDCMYMGPYGRMDYGARGSRNNLPVPSWSRSNTEQQDADGQLHSRAFALPCSGDNLNGDYKVPFTCGSASRRAVIKYFVRSYAAPSGVISGQCGTEDLNRTVQDANKQRILAVLHAKLNSLHSDWTSISNYACEQRGADGNITGVQGVQYCTGDPITWTPNKLRDWDHATTAQVASEIFSSAKCFYEKSMRDANVWFQHLDVAERTRYDWSSDPGNSYSATESSLFHTNAPVVSYGEDELGEPMSNGTVSMWEMCAGLLGQVYFTLPLKKNSLGQYVPTTLQSDSTTGYSPYTPSKTANISALEDFVMTVSRSAYYASPFYRHYAMRHLASDSAGCPSVAKQVQDSNTVPKGSTYRFKEETEYGVPLTDGSLLGQLNISRKGIKYGLLGASGRHTCFCGFVALQVVPPLQHPCELPMLIQEHLRAVVLVVITADMQYLRDVIVSAQGGTFSLSQNERVQRTLSTIWLGELWTCPEMQVADHWGIVRDATAWVSSSEGSELRANDLLETGYGGLRAGTVQYVLKEAAAKITPRQRIGTMNPSDGGTLTGQTRFVFLAESACLFFSGISLFILLVEFLTILDNS